MDPKEIPNGISQTEILLSHSSSAGQWGIALVGLGVLIFLLAYGIKYLIPVGQIPAANQPGIQSLAATSIPTIPDTETAAPTVAATPVLSLTTQSWVTIDRENEVTAGILRSCPSTACAVVGEMAVGQEALAVGMISDGSWIQVEYPGSPDGTAWIYRGLVTISGDLPPIVLVLPSPTPFLPAVAPQACSPSGPVEMLLGYLPEHPTQMISGGNVQSGDFIFEIWLGCDSLFGPDAEYSNHYSDIPGLGFHLALSYRGGTLDGEIIEAWGVQGEGVQATMDRDGSSTSGKISSSRMTHLTGLRIPPELLQNLSQANELPLEFIYQARDPQGEWAGAALFFTLIYKPDGFYLSDITIQPLSAQELPAEKPSS